MNEPALIVSGPRDGEILVHPSPILEIPVWDYKICSFMEYAVFEPIKVEKLVFRREMFRSKALGDMHVFVPVDWPKKDIASKVLEFLLAKAFKKVSPRRRT
jgi:hypothetical protein